MPRKRKPLSQLDGQVISEKRQRSHSADSQRTLKARPGTVSRMILKNFMCHSHLEVTFTNNINFISGRNGSGKSAILTALVVGLGGKASLTNRGNCIKGFIKVNKVSATIEITLRNAGPFSYRHNAYGDEITVIRQFGASGSSSYKIKSSSGQIVSRQAKEVQRICTGLSIQIDNPVCLLNQDTSRNFLNTKDPHQKFLLFMRATRLEALMEEYKKIFDNNKSATRALKEKQAAYKELKKELEEVSEKVKNQKRIALLHQQKRLLEMEVLWAKVNDSEDAVRQQQDVVDQLEGEKASIEEKLKDENKRKSTIEQTIQNLQQQVADLQESIERQNNPQRALVNSLSELKQSINEKRREKQTILKSIAVKTGNCSILEQEIAKATENSSQIEEERMKRLQELSSIERKIKSMADLLGTSKNEQFQMRNSISRLQEEEHSLMAEVKQIDSQIENTNSRINAFQGESNSLSVYGRDMSRIVEEINSNKDRFTHMPRGPLGSYIKLKDKKWAVAVEGFLSAPILRAFAVDNKEDNKLLMSIFQKICPRSTNKPVVITSKFFFNTHDVRENLVKAVDGCVSVYSALEISDPVVANCLIDQSGLESVLLIPDTDTAIRLMSDRRRVPKNCQQGVTIRGDKYYPDPNYKTYASHYHNAQFLQVSAADMISQLKQRLCDLKDKRTSVVNQRNSIKGEFQEQTTKMKQLEVKIAKLERAHLLLKNQHNELSDSAEPDAANVQQLENELNELKKVIEQQTVVSQKIEEGFGELKGKIAEKDAELNRIKMIVRGYEDRIEPLNQQIHEEMTKRKEYDVNKRFGTKRLEESRNKVSLGRSELLKRQGVVERQLEQASEVGERPENVRQVTVIVEELNMTERTIRQVVCDPEDQEVLLKRKEDCEKRDKEARELMKTMGEDVNEIKMAVVKRNDYVQCTVDYFETIVKHSFQRVLHLRQFQGSLELNMKDGKLDLIVIPQQGSQGITTSTNLSGGERSFSTVAFLYALWQCMEFPFYFLDEFDVFMDKVNRTKVMEILLYHAKAVSDSQFVFLTPQDVSFVHEDAVDIHRLDDPERAAVREP